MEIIKIENISYNDACMRLQKALMYITETKSVGQDTFFYSLDNMVAEYNEKKGLLQVYKR